MAQKERSKMNENFKVSCNYGPKVFLFLILDALCATFSLFYVFFWQI